MASASCISIYTKISRKAGLLTIDISWWIRWFLANFCVSIAAWVIFKILRII